MSGSLNEILPEPISQESEKILEAHLKRKMTGALQLAVKLLHAMEKRFGPDAREVVRDMANPSTPAPRSDAGEPEADLREFCGNLDKACAGSHRWVKIVDEPRKIGYEYTRCMWADILRELGEPDLGFVICAGDEPAVKHFNPKMGFRRTKVLMHGDDICDHVFVVEDDS